MEEPKEYWEQQAEELRKAGKFEKAVKALDKVQTILKEEKQEDFWFKKSRQCFEIGNYQQARDAIFKDLELGNKSYNRFLLLGEILYNLGNNEEAIESLNKASEEFARKQLRSSIKMDQMRKVRKFEEVVRYSTEGHRQQELDSGYWHLRGLILFKLSKFDEASSCLETALNDNKLDINLQYDFAKSELWNENKQNAIKILKDITSKDSSIKEKIREDKDFHKFKEELLIQKIL